MSEKEREKIFKELFDTSYDKLYYLAYGIIGDPDVAEDIVEDSFALLWERTRSLSAFPQTNYSYIATMIRNACQDHLRHQQVRQRFIDFYLHAHTEGVLALDDLREERIEKINQVRNAMPAKTRYIMDLCYFENKKYDEVAAITGLTKNGVRKQMIKALGMLRDAFSVNKPKR